MVDNPNSYRFFSSIQNALSTKFSGRLLSLAIGELGRHDPSAFCELLSDINKHILTKQQAGQIMAGDAQFLLEWARVRGRRADLAVLLNGEPVLLFEIKEDDVAAAGNEAQLDDYLTFIARREGKTRFIHLSRYPPKKTLRRLAAAEKNGTAFDVRYRQLLDVLIDRGERSTRASPVGRMIKEYLEDIGVDAFRQIDLTEDSSALTFLLVQVGALKHFTGKRRLQSQISVRRGIALLAELVGNANALGGWLHEANLSLLKQRPLARLRVYPGFSRSDLERQLKKSERDVIYPEPGASEAEAYFEARSKLPSKDSLYMVFGHAISFDDDMKRARTFPFARVEWKGDAASADGEYHTVYPSEALATRELASLMRKARTLALKTAPTHYHATLKKLVVP